MDATDLPRNIRDSIYLLQSARQQVEVAKRSASFIVDVDLCNGKLSREQHEVATELIETGSHLPQPAGVN